MSVTFLDNKDKDELLASIGALSKEIGDVKATDFEVAADGSIRMLDESKRRIAVEYMGLNTAAAVDGKSVLTPASANIRGARIYYRFEARKGDLINFTPTEHWTAPNYQYEPVELDADGKILKADGFSIVTANTPMTALVRSDDVAEVRIGFRYEPNTTTPSQWGVIDNDFEKAFTVTVTCAAEGAGYVGHFVTVDKDGMLRTSNVPFNSVALKATTDGGIRMSGVQARQIEVKYMGLCTGSGGTGQKHNLTQNVSPGTAGARIYYQFEARQGDVITIQKTELWTQSSFMYEALECDDALIVQLAPTFSTSYNNAVKTVVKESNTTLVRLAIRFDYTTPPSGWGVVDDDFENAFVVTVGENVGTEYTGHRVVVGADGLSVGTDKGRGQHRELL